ncbi:MAG: aldo/keto reductase [Bacteroidota bacterium]
MSLEQTSSQLHFTLNQGSSMPALGLGVLFAKNDGEVEQAVTTALQAGYRKIDTASAYQNETGVGQGIRDSGIPRTDIFLTSKVWNSEQGYEQTLQAFDQSLARLGTDYLDLYLIHWPVPGKYLQTYRALERLYTEGRAKAIGVCNFSIPQLEELMAKAEVVPAVNQVEMHPHLQQAELLAFAREHSIQLEAWRPIMMGEVLDIPELVTIGQRYGKSAVQVTLRWLIQRGVAIIPKSTNPERIRQNMEVFDVELTAADMQAIGALNQDRRLGEDLSEVV